MNIVKRMWGVFKILLLNNIFKMKQINLHIIIGQFPCGKKGMNSQSNFEKPLIVKS